MPRKKIQRSRLLGPELRRRREELNLSTGDVARLTRRDDRPIPASTLAKIETGDVDPGVLRLHQLLKIYGLPMQAAQDLLDLEEVAADLPAGDDPERLLEDGRRLLGRGDIENALAHAIAVRQKSTPGSELRIRGTLAFTAMCVKLGKHRLALNLLQDVFVAELTPRHRVTAYVQAALAWGGLGAVDVALAFLERAEKHMQRGDPHQRAWVHHTTASVLADLERWDDALAAADRAERAYRSVDAPADRIQLKGLRIRVLIERGDHESALRLARRARREATRKGAERAATFRRQDEAEALIGLGRSDEAIVVLDVALAHGLATQDRYVQFRCHDLLARAYDAADMPERARVERDAAAFFVRYVDETNRYTRSYRKEGDRDGGVRS